LVAIDVAKRTHDVLVQWPSGKTRAFRTQNQKDDFQQLTDFLTQHDLPVRVALEPTADFHRPLAHWLLRSGFEVHLVSSLACARVREAIFNSWDKHDRKDAKVILYLLQQGLTEPFHDPLVEGYLDLQELSNTYRQISLAKTRCYHSLLNHYLPLFFPEMERFLHSTRAEWFCRFMIRFPTPGAVTNLDRDTFVKAAWDIVGRKVAKQRFLEELHELSANTIALPIAEDSPAVHTFRLQLQRYLSLSGSRDEIEQRSHDLLEDNPDYQRLRTMPGVGPVIALMIMAESGDLRRFRHHRQYLKFCGFDLSATQSGQTQSKYKLSKRGNSRLRYAYWIAATTAVRQQENSFRYKYQRYIRRDPDDADLKRKAKTAVAVKMARVAHALIKKGVDYRGYHEVALPGGGT
jgi:transposase